jgi:hypothetical protein
MSLAYADEAIRIRQRAPLTERDIARATRAGVSTVSAWLHRTRAHRPPDWARRGIVPSKKVGRRRLYVRARIEALLLGDDTELSP